MRSTGYIWVLVAAVILGVSVVGYAAPAAGPAGAPVSPGPTGPAVTGTPSGAAPTDIHDIRHPVQVGVNPAWYYWPAAGVGALIIGGLIWLLIRWRRKRNRAEVTDVTAAVYRTPEEELREGLGLLEAAMPVAPVVFYFRLSALFRHYLQRRFDIDAPEMTTEELLPRLTGLDLDRETRDRLKAFVKFGDQVKFARSLPDPADMTAHLSLVRDLADRWTPPEDEAKGGTDVPIR